MWYGLKKDGKLVAIEWFSHSPAVSEFGKGQESGVNYAVVVVRIREIGVADAF